MTAFVAEVKRKVHWQSSLPDFTNPLVGKFIWWCTSSRSTTCRNDRLFGDGATRHRLVWMFRQRTNLWNPSISSQIWSGLVETLKLKMWLTITGSCGRSWVKAAATCQGWRHGWRLPCLVCDPTILIMDEAISTWCWNGSKLLKNLSQRGCTQIIVAHDWVRYEMQT